MIPPEPFEEFLKAHWNLVFHSAQRLLDNASDAEDIAQEVFLRFWNQFPDQSGVKSIHGWLGQVTRNLCINHLKRHRARWKLFADWSDEEECENPVDTMVCATTETPDAQLHSSDRQQWMAQALASLPSEQRMFLTLHYFEGMAHADIAAQLGVSKCKVKIDTFRARKTLRRKLQTSRHYGEAF